MNTNQCNIHYSFEEVSFIWYRFVLIKILAVQEMIMNYYRCLPLPQSIQLSTPCHSPFIRPSFSKHSLSFLLFPKVFYCLLNTLSIYCQYPFVPLFLSTLLFCSSSQKCFTTTRALFHLSFPPSLNSPFIFLFYRHYFPIFIIFKLMLTYFLFPFSTDT